MPATFESFGIKFLYPDNWTVAARGEDESEDGVTLDLPSGGFFSIEVDDEGLTNEEVVERVHEALRAEYTDIEIEIEEVKLEGSNENEQTTELRFYYLDLLIVSRIIIIIGERETLIVQIQDESRDFDKNEPVYAAIMQQIRV